MQIQLMRLPEESVRLIRLDSSLVSGPRDEIDANRLEEALEKRQSIPPLCEEGYISLVCQTYDLKPGCYVAATLGPGYLDYRKITVFPGTVPGCLTEESRRNCCCALN
ncbi:hypothetical protein CEB3_c13880 [Peptococcaceae bacterium CEB3]|nr:hypothetical protein CEB3_c13880 [Peptococcaceae bacterium CEB3]